MFSKPVQFHNFLDHHGLTEDIYKAMSSSDLSEPVTTALNILRKTNTLPALIKESKSESKSAILRNEGNLAYGSKKYQKALVCYNKALLHAPNNSRAMKLAYSNRSALLYKLKAFSACLNDIDTCFSIGCPLEIIDKLRKRREEAKSCLWMEKLAEDAVHSVFSDEYFQLNVKRNPQIPCASTDVGVIIENQVPKIIATTDVKVGTVLAVETAFVSLSDPQNGLFSCYYCHKMNLNLKPCDGCCFVLFCDEECRENCLKMYHNTECKIIDMIESIAMGTMPRLALKAVLKMKYMSKSWRELHAATYSMGVKRLKTSSINDIYDSNSKFSLLSVKDERLFLNGPLYNASFISAAIIHYLETNGYFPQTQGERNEAVKTFARLLMFLMLYTTNTQIVLCMSISKQEKTEYHNIPNYGWFSFIGKLINSCNPNVLAVGLNKKIGLLAVAPIKKGTELTLSYVGHWLDGMCNKDIRNRNMYMLYGSVCNCLVCSRDYKINNGNELTEIQKKNFRKLNIAEMTERFNLRNVPEIFTKLCKTLAFLSDMPYSDEYDQVFRLFRRCILFFQDLITDNVILDYV